jgi:predicted transcriptional regulator
MPNESIGQNSQKCPTKCPTYLLCYIKEYGDKLKELSNKLNISRDCLYKRLQRLIKTDLVERTQSYPSAVYKLTPKGEWLDRNLVHNESITIKKPIWKIHNFVVRFPIISFGSISFDGNNNKNIVQMNNWAYFDTIQEDFLIRIQSNGLIRVFCPSKVTLEPEQGFTRLSSKAQDIAKNYCEQLGMTLGLMQVSRKGHKTLIKSEHLAKLLGKFRTDEVWTDDSEGTGDELEEHQDSQIIESLLALPKKIDILTNVTTDLSVNIRLHLDVLTKMSNSLDLFNENMKKMNENLKELNHGRTKGK